MINIPDNVYKIFVGIGLVGLAFGYLSLEGNKKRYEDYYQEFSLQRDGMNEKIGQLNVDRTRHQKMSARLSKKYNLPDPLNAKDSAAIFTDLTGDPLIRQVKDSLFSLYLNYEAGNRLLAIQQRTLARQREYLADARQVHDSSLFRLKAIMIAGGVMFFVGLMGLINQESDEDRLKYFQPNGQKKYYERCQSCARKFSPVITCGTNEDNTYNSAFCRFCFDKGRFTEPELSKEELWKRVKGEMKKVKGLRVNKRMLGKLARWKSNLYS